MRPDDTNTSKDTHMSAPNDRVVLSIEERRTLAALEDRTRRDDPELTVLLTSGWRFARLYSLQLRNIAAGLCFIAGVALMLTTFVRWPPIGASDQRRLDTRHEDIT